MLRDTIQKIAEEYPAASRQPFANHPLATFIRNDAVEEVRAALGPQSAELLLKGSAGAGNFAAVPWIAAFDPIITNSATRGYYVVYLFSDGGQSVHLSLNQGATATREEFGRDAPKVLQDRAALMRSRLQDFVGTLPVKEILLGSTQTLPKDYEFGHALGCSYKIGAFPAEAQIKLDLQNIISAYRALIFRGGLEPSPEQASGADDDLPPAYSTSIMEIRKYRMHRKVERNSRAAALAKRVHGTVCQACGFNFSGAYGPLGNGFIEAHHLRPISSLTENVPVSLDVASDFAVLCSNCHRMIHRTEDPSDLSILRKLLTSNFI